MTPINYIHNGSMVLRLRLSFLLIFAALVAFGLFSQSKFGDISARKGDLSQRAIPVLVRAQEMVALLSVQSQQIATLRDIDTTADFDAIAQLADRRQAQFEDSLTEYQALTSEVGLLEAAQDLSSSMTRLIDLQTYRKSLANHRIDQLSELRGLVETIEIQIEGMRLDVLTQVQSNIEQLSVDPDAVDRMVAQSVQLNTLISLGLLIERIQDLSQNNQGGRVPSGSGDVAEEIRFKLRQILGLVNRIPASEQRAQLSVNLVATRDLVLGPLGILRNADEQRRVQQDISQRVDVSDEQVRQIEIQIAQTIAAANDGARETSQLLDQSIRTLTLTNFVMITGFFGGLVLVVLFLVEVQLNRRIQSLTASVRQFSLGNYEDDIDVFGTDELGEVADALRNSQKVAQDLKRSNADLKSFAYAASHDLKTPLRAITELADWTLEDAREELSPDNLQNLELLSSRSARLSNLLDGLLLYAQVDGMEDQNARFDLAKECSEIADLLDPEGRFKVTVEEPTRWFSMAVIPMRQILNNLLSNAMKHHDKGTGHITVRAKILSQFVQIEVEDDGPGIPAIYHQRIFELFQKLESADVVEGAGIGLALVKKLAERHGGGVQLRAQHNQERGTVFTVLMSMGQPDEPAKTRTS